MTGKRMDLRFLIFCIILLVAPLCFAQKVNTIVLDAGHGGHDTGALGRHSREKDITLSIALKLRDYILENLKDTKVIMTRSDDTFIELFRRAKIANENKADLFISIHCNATKSSSIYGVETFVMGMHKSEANLAVAKAENASILLEDNYVEKYDGFDPTSAEGNIFFSMMQNAFLDRSLSFAGKVQNQIAHSLNKLDRGVKQAGFLVLYKTAMPGVLIETGFISNPNDELFLLSSKGQDEIAEAIGKALKAYKSGNEEKNRLTLHSTDIVLASNSKPDKKTQSYLERNPVVDSRMNTENKKSEKKYTDTVKPGSYNQQNNIQPKKQVKEKETFSDKPILNENISFRVQFATSATPDGLNNQDVKGLENIRKYFHNGLYKFTAGDFSRFEEASQLRLKVIKLGFKDAFVIAFEGDKRIPTEEARSIIGKMK